MLNLRKGSTEQELAGLFSALECAFGAQENGPTLARGSILYDIGHDLVLDAQVAATCVGEHELAIEHLAHAAPGDLLIYDRGYPAFWFFALHLSLGIDFCMRLSRSSADSDFGS